MFLTEGLSLWEEVSIKLLLVAFCAALYGIWRLIRLGGEGVLKLISEILHFLFPWDENAWLKDREEENKRLSKERERRQKELEIKNTQELERKKIERIKAEKLERIRLEEERIRKSKIEEQKKRIRLEEESERIKRKKNSYHSTNRRQSGGGNYKRCPECGEWHNAAYYRCAPCNGFSAENDF